MNAAEGPTSKCMLTVVNKCSESCDRKHLSDREKGNFDNCSENSNHCGGSGRGKGRDTSNSHVISSSDGDNKRVLGVLECDGHNNNNH